MSEIIILDHEIEKLQSAEDLFFACYSDDVPQNGGVCVKYQDEQIAIFNFTRRGEWYATQNMCPHKQQMALSRGMIGSSGEDCEPKIACPFHKKSFSLKTGDCLTGEGYKIKTYPVTVVDGKVFIEIKSIAFEMSA